MRAKALNWSGFWSRPVFPGRLQEVNGSVREVYLAGESKPEPIDPVVFKATARAYGIKRSNGSDHWAAKEFAALPVEIVERFTSLINDCGYGHLANPAAYGPYARPWQT